MHSSLARVRRVARWGFQTGSTFVLMDAQDNESVARLLTPPHNYAVVQLPDRQYPGVVFQGDSLSILCERLAAAEQAAAGTAVHHDIACISEDLESVLRSYIHVLSERNIQIPFSYRPSPKAG
jgi:hypothetical protein